MSLSDKIHMEDNAGNYVVCLQVKDVKEFIKELKAFKIDGMVEGSLIIEDDLIRFIDKLAGEKLI